MRPIKSWHWATAALALAAADSALADRHGASTPLLPAYKQECAACHVAYPPGMLPAPSWQRLMANLSHHFGSDASIDAAQVKQIEGWLLRSAGPGRAQDTPPEDRITRSAWFLREHRKVSPTTWARPSVKGPANCAACHETSDLGDFNEHNVRIPR